MLLKTSHFTIRPYRIQNLESAPDFIAFIEKVERKILTSILGYSLWTEVTAIGTLSETMTKLRDGAEYEYNDVTYKYYGLVDLLKPAAMSNWIEQNNYIFSDMGYVEKTPQQQNTLIDPQAHIATLWNEYVEKVGYCYAHQHKGEGTLYGFMKSNESDYPNWEFNIPERKNRFGM
jgi:hypothetical protein